LLAVYFKILMALRFMHGINAERVGGLVNLTASIARKKLAELQDYGLVTVRSSRYSLSEPGEEVLLKLSNPPSIEYKDIHPELMDVLQEMLDLLKYNSRLTVEEFRDLMGKRPGLIRDMLLILARFGLVKETYELGILKWELI
jgi:Mn-dependent DtxR family transcriptional regulator